MDVEEVEPFIITIDGKRVEREVKKIFEVRSDRRLNLPTSGTKGNKLILPSCEFRRTTNLQIG
jgi:hypothetical protein